MIPNGNGVDLMSPSISLKRLIVRLRIQIRRVLKADSTPHEIALGMAIGVFIGCMPVFGFQSIVAFCVAWMLSSNKPACILGVNIHDPFFLCLLQWAWQAHIGAWLLGNDLKVEEVWRLLLKIEHHPMGGFNALKGIWMNFLVGGLVIGIPLFIGTYYLTRRAAAAIQARRALRRGRSRRGQSKEALV